MLIVTVLSLMAFIGSILWYIHTPDYEPAIAVITSLVGLIVALRSQMKRKSQAAQSQSVSGNSVGVQAGGSVRIGSIHSGSEENR